MPKPRKEIIIDKIYDELNHDVRREFIAMVIHLFATQHGIRQFLAKRRCFRVRHLGKFTPTPSERDRYKCHQKSMPKRRKRGMDRRDKRNRDKLVALNEYMAERGYKLYKQLPHRMTKLVRRQKRKKNC